MTSANRLRKLNRLNVLTCCPDELRKMALVHDRQGYENVLTRYESGFSPIAPFVHESRTAKENNG